MNKKSNMRLNITKHTQLDSISIIKYFSELSTDKHVAPLTKVDELAMFKEYAETKNPKLKERIIKSNLRYVITIAKQYEYPKAKREDLISEGNIGLINAFESFDYKRGAAFLTYATWYIRLQIKDYIDNVLADIAQPGNRFRINKLMSQAEKILIKKGYEYPTDEQLVEIYTQIKEPKDPQITVALYHEIKVNGKDFRSMNTVISSSSSDTTEMCLGDTFKANPEFETDIAFKIADQKYEINQLLHKHLNEREKMIVEYSFGLNGREEKTLDQISDTMNFTRERIGQLLQEALRKLKSEKGKIYELCGTNDESSSYFKANTIHN